MSPRRPRPCRSASARRAARRDVERPRRSPRARRCADDLARPPARSSSITGRPSTPGGSVPRAISASDRARRRSAPASRASSSRWPTPHCSRPSSSTGSASSTSSEKSPTLMPEPLAQERPHRPLDEAHEVVELDQRGARAAAAARPGTAARGARSPASARAPSQRRPGRSSTASSGTSAPASKLRGSNGCSGWRTTTCRARGGGRARPRRAARRPGRRAGGEVRALVVAGVGDDQPVGRGHQRVEQQLAVLGARVALADVRVGEHQVVAVARRLARERAVVEPEQADDAVRDRAHRHERADRQVAGAEVRARRAALQALGEQRADLGAARARRRGCRAASRDDVVEQPLQLGALPGVARRGRGRARRRRAASASAHASTVCGRLQRVERRAAAGRPARRSGRRGRSPRSRRRRAAARRRTAAGRPRSSSRRAAAGRARRARCRLGSASSLNGARCAASSPQRMPLARDPLLAAARGRRRRAGSAGGPARGRRGRAPARRSAARSASSSSRATTPSTGLVWRSERSASRTRRSGGGARPTRLVVLVGLARAERRLDERRERLDVRAHDDHVARLERRVLVEQVQDRVAQHLDLAGAAVAGVDLDAAVGRRARGSARRRSSRARRPGCARAACRCGAATGWWWSACVAAPSTSCSSRASWPQEASSAVARQPRRRIVGPPARRRRRWLGDPLPQGGRGCSRNRWTSRCAASALQHLQMTGRQPRQAEQREALRQVGSSGSSRSRAHATSQPLGGAGHGDPRRAARATARACQ